MLPLRGIGISRARSCGAFRWLLVPALVALGAWGPPDAARVEAVAPGPAATPPVPPGWQRVDALSYGAGFSLALPPGWEYHELRGIDSFVGEFVGDGVRLGFDYGMYSNSLPGPGAAGYDITFELIGGREAKLVFAREAPANLTGVYFPQVAAHRPPWTDRLNVVGADLTTDQQAVALLIFRSIRFPNTLVADSGTWEVAAVPDVAALSGLDVVSADSAWAVGTGGAILRFEEGSWRDVPSPTEGDLLAVDMVSPEEGWAVGDSTILRYSAGEGWSVAAFNVAGHLRDVQLTDAGTGWIVGEEVLLALDKGTWRPVAGDIAGRGIDLLGPGDGWIVGDGSLFQLVAGTWRREPWPGDPGGGGAAAAMATPRDGWLVGSAGCSAKGMARRYSSGTWQGPYFGGTAPSALWDVSASGPGEAWAVGGTPRRGCRGVDDGEMPADIVHLAVAVWRAVENPFRGTVFDVEMLDTEDGWAVGTRVTDLGRQAVVLQYAAWDAAGPTATASPSPPGKSTPESPRVALYLPLLQRR